MTGTVVKVPLAQISVDTGQVLTCSNWGWHRIITLKPTFQYDSLTTIMSSFIAVFPVILLAMDCLLSIYYYQFTDLKKQ